MAVHRQTKKKNYTCLSNALLQNKDLSLKAKGLLCMMLSLPDTWEYSINGLTAISKESELCIKTVLTELKAKGYVKVIRKMPNETKSKKIEYLYEIYEKPQKQEGGFQGVDNQGVDNQPIGNQGLGNQGVDFYTQINNKQQITKEKIIKEESNKEKGSCISSLLSSIENQQDAKDLVSDELLNEYFSEKGN